jgi:hypothetical protein
VVNVDDILVCILHSITYLSSAVILISARAEASVVSPISCVLSLLSFAVKDGVSQAFAIQGMHILSEEELLHCANGIGQQNLVQLIYFCQMILHAYWLHNYDEAARLSELYGEDYCMMFLDIYHIFIVD